MNAIQQSPAGPQPAPARRGAEVELRALTRHYGQVAAVRGVNLTVRPAEFVTLLGPSGSGKTTTLMLIAGFLRPSAGDILINGRSVVDMPPHRRNLGVVFQNYALFPHMSVFDNVAFPLRMRHQDAATVRRRVQAALDLVQLGGLGHRRTTELSGGQQQRVALARALIFEPPVLLMDEPLGALDRKLRAEMQLELKRLQRALGLTVIYVTHDQEEALVLSDQIAVMHDGVVHQVGAPAEVYERPATDFVAGFVGESNFLDGVVATVGVDGARIRLTAAGVTVGGPPAGTLAPGHPVRVMLRPEALCLSAASPDGENDAAPGVVEEAIYLGQSIHYSVRVGDTALVVREPHRPGDLTFSRGARVWVAWPERITVFTPR